MLRLAEIEAPELAEALHQAALFSANLATVYGMARFESNQR